VLGARYKLNSQYSTVQYSTVQYSPVGKTTLGEISTNLSRSCARVSDVLSRFCDFGGALAAAFAIATGASPLVSGRRRRVAARLRPPLLGAGRWLNTAAAWRWLLGAGCSALASRRPRSPLVLLEAGKTNEFLATPPC
jgi:hypothetical protein